jgi:hypothetical protein
LALRAGKQPDRFHRKGPLDASAKAGHPGRGLGWVAVEVGHVKLFRTWLKDQPRPYAVFLADEEQWAALDRKTFIEQQGKHWHIEHYHRAITQVCHIEHFQVRSQVAVKNHLFAALCG